MSFTPNAPLRRSFKEDREERRRRRETKIRTRVVAIGAVLAVLGLVGWGVYNQADIVATVSGWFAPKAPPKAVVAVHAIGSTIHPHIKLLAGVTPTPGLTPTPFPTPTSLASPTATPLKTPKPKASALATKPARPNVFALSTSFASPPTPAPLAAATPAPATPTPAPATPAPIPTPAAEVYAPQVVVDARFANRVQPDYPEVAREQGIEGTAVVLVTVGPKGNVLSQRLEKSAGHPLLDQAALAAAARSSFQPPKIDGKPATETYRIVYAFTP